MLVLRNIIAAALIPGVVVGAIPYAIVSGRVRPGANIFVIFYEERTLARQFGAPYEEYKRSVGRWFPGVR